MKKITLKSIKSQFKNTDLFDQAFTHRSYLNENKGVKSHNERVEFLGDAVLEYVVSSALFKKFPKKEEGFLTALRSNIVNTKNLSNLAHFLKLGENLKMSKGEAQGGGAKNDSLLANTMEALIGAIYLDQGLNAVKNFIKDFILADLDKKLEEPLKDPKSLLQEKVQSLGYPTPRYEVVEEHGPDHQKIFKVKVKYNGKFGGRGEGSSKARAEQEAAKAALARVALKKV